MTRAPAAIVALILALLLPFEAAMAAEPLPTPKKIFFATGSIRGMAGGHVRRGARDLYSLTASAGQFMTVTLTTPGTYYYNDPAHPQDTGVITVQPD